MLSDVLKAVFGLSDSDASKAEKVALDLFEVKPKKRKEHVVIVEGTGEEVTSNDGSKNRHDSNE